MRTINFKPIIDWVHQHGQNGASELAFKAKLSPSFIAKIMAENYPYTLREATMYRICEVIALPIDDVFPKKLPAPQTKE